VRKVQADCAIEVDGNAYSVPWRLIGESVRVVITGEQLRISHAGREIAVHHRRSGRFGRVVDPVHFDGVVGSRSKAPLTTVSACEPVGVSELLRPLLEYERAVGGRWNPTTTASTLMYVFNFQGPSLTKKNEPCNPAAAAA
jgi:hypothetical protein